MGVYKMTIKIKTVKYCGECGLPPEYCEFVSSQKKWIKCQDWMKEHCPELYLQFENLVIGGGKKSNEDNKDKEGDSENKKENDDDKEEEKDNEGDEGKKPQPKKNKKEVEKVITISMVQRTKRKRITVVSGLQHFDIKLKPASKKFSQVFACGASIVKSPKGDEIHIQGDVGYELADILEEKYNIDEDDIKFIES